MLIYHYHNVRQQNCQRLQLPQGHHRTKGVRKKPIILPGTPRKGSRKVDSSDQSLCGKERGEQQVVQRATSGKPC